MGWVAERFLGREAFVQGLPVLWNRVRDSIGQAVLEFNERTANTKHTINSTDCAAKGRFCLRLSKSPGDSPTLELFLDEAARCLKTSLSGGPETRVCGFRLAEDRSSLEFFLDGTAYPSLVIPESSVPVDRACELAAAAFVFTPFPS